MAAFHVCRAVRSVERSQERAMEAIFHMARAANSICARTAWRHVRTVRLQCEQIWITSHVVGVIHGFRGHAERGTNDCEAANWMRPTTSLV